MEAHRALIVILCVGLYFGLCLGVGVWALRRTRSARDFFMAGRNLGMWVTSVAVFSSVMSGFGFVGGPGLVYSLGTSSFWIVMSAALGNALCFMLLGRRLRAMAIERDSISLPDIVATRYGSRRVGLLAAIAILLGVFGYLATQIAAMSQVLRSLLIESFGPEVARLEYCAAFSTALLVFYCVTGGIIASVYTDMVQGLIMMVAAVLVFITAMMSVEGGLVGMSQTIMRDDFAAMGPFGTRGMFAGLSWYFVFALGVCGQPHVITKLMMTRSSEDVRMILPMTIAGYSVTALLWIGLGLAMRTLVLQGDLPELHSADQAAPVFLNNYAHPLLAGLVFAGLFAAIMSTADAFLNIGVAAVMHDIPVALRGRPLRNELFAARLATVLIAIVAAAIALYSRALVAVLGIFGWGTFAAALVPTVALGLNWSAATPLAAGTAIVASLAVNFGIVFFQVDPPLGLDAGCLSMLISISLFLGISLVQQYGRRFAARTDAPQAPG